MISQIFKTGGGAGIGSFVLVLKDGALLNVSAEKVRWSYDSGENLYLSIVDDSTEEALLPLSGYVDNEGVLHLSGRDFDDNKTYDFAIDNVDQSVHMETIDGITMGNGTIPTEGGADRTYNPFNSEWPTDNQHTTAQFCAAIDADDEATVGMAYLGGASWSDLPFEGNGDVVVEIMQGPAQSKSIHLIMTSGNVYPYRWEYTYWNHGSNSGWIAFCATAPVFTALDLSIEPPEEFILELQLSDIISIMHNKYPVIIIDSGEDSGYLTFYRQIESNELVIYNCTLSMEGLNILLVATFYAEGNPEDPSDPFVAGSMLILGGESPVTEGRACLSAILSNETVEFIIYEADWEEYLKDEGYYEVDVLYEPPVSDQLFASKASLYLSSERETAALETAYGASGVLTITYVEGEGDNYYHFIARRSNFNFPIDSQYDRERLYYRILDKFGPESVSFVSVQGSIITGFIDGLLNNIHPGNQLYYSGIFSDGDGNLVAYKDIVANDDYYGTLYIRHEAGE